MEFIAGTQAINVRLVANVVLPSLTYSFSRLVPYDVGNRLPTFTAYLLSATVLMSQKTEVTEWLAVAADIRGNLIRMIGIAGFYTIHLVSVSFPDLNGSVSEKLHGSAVDVSSSVHVSVSLIVFAWIMIAVGVHLAAMTSRLSRRMAIGVILGDVAGLTASLCFSTGPDGPMVAGYFLIIALAGLRLDLWLVRWATVAACLGYLFVLGATRWPVGLLKKIELTSVPRYHQVMMLVAIGLMGVLIGQIVRLGWGMVAARLTADGTESGVADE